MDSKICKPKFKINSARSNSPTLGGSNHSATLSSSQSSRQRGGVGVGSSSPPTKLYKHVALFSLNNVTKVCDILQNNDDTDLFGFVCRLPGEKDKFYFFKVMASSSSSSSFGSNGFGI